LLWDKRVEIDTGQIKLPRFQRELLLGFPEDERTDRKALEKKSLPLWRFVMQPNPDE
jgi:hypothetical protein